MQADSIVLAVDEANNGTTIDHTFERYEETQNRSLYVAASHEPTKREMIALYRSMPTRAGNFKGVQKSSFKITKDVNIPGVDNTTEVASAVIIEVNFSVPAGYAPEELLKWRQTVLALLDNDTIMDKLNIQLMV